MVSYEALMHLTTKKAQDIEQFLLKKMGTQRLKFIKIIIEDVAGNEFETLYYGKDQRSHHYSMGIWRQDD